MQMKIVGFQSNNIQKVAVQDNCESSYPAVGFFPSPPFFNPYLLLRA